VQIFNRPGPTLDEKKLQDYQSRYGLCPELEDIAEFYSLISNPIRLKIVHLLREEPEVCEGQTVFYSLNGHPWLDMIPEFKP